MIPTTPTQSTPEQAAQETMSFQNKLQAEQQHHDRMNFEIKKASIDRKDRQREYWSSLVLSIIAIIVSVAAIVVSVVVAVCVT